MEYSRRICNNYRNENFYDIALSEYYIHNNYKSFIQQLQLIGYTKKKKNINEGVEFEHEKFYGNISKKQINQITRKRKAKKNLIKLY